MKARKLNLKSYKVKRQRIEDGNVKDVEEDYDPKEIIPNIICHPTLKHKGFRFHTIAQIACKIEKCKEDHIVLDIKDYEALKKCFDDFQGYGKNDAKMVAYIYEAEEIEVEEKKK